VVPDGEPRFGFPNISDNAEIVELIACGRAPDAVHHGRGSVVGSAISPVIKVCANPETARRLAADMDSQCRTRPRRGDATLGEVADEIHALVLGVARGERTVSEALGHREFILTYKAFEPIGPAACRLAATARTHERAAGGQGRAGDGGGAGHRPRLGRALRTRRRRRCMPSTSTKPRWQASKAATRIAAT
jgi:hypothetical protein